ncbi:hypothetical protein [Agrobacterium sp. LMR679]|uniref:hypothetical protein n=1 Tax=Agrobacterium sp. LMR679 TaxID=3014335 RepID=UPI0022AEB7F3|nr:hypothetical protein [Agrobacterium sp. LMR679]MCZ4074331.1 hypothetical protein [Agrobacterium sp. LMR679]
MVLADDLGEIITQRRAEIFIRGEDITLEIEFYDRLRSRYRIEHISVICAFP